MEFKEMLTEKVNLVRRRFTRASELLTNYLHKDGDSTEVLIQKRIWWLLMVSGLPVLLIMSLAIFGRAVNMVNTLNIIFGSIMLGSLLIFHFYKSHIELHILLIQLTILSLTIMKVYLMGGLFYAGTPIFVGFAAPLYALTTRNRKRALLFFLIYLSGMIIATELQPIAVYESYVYHYGGFLMGTSMAFFGLYYYTGQLELLKEREKIRMRELDETKNKFYTHITHEFRTPLTIIQGMADQIKEDPKADLNSRLNMIRKNGSKLLSMTNQLLDLSKLKANILPMHWVQQDIIAFLSYQVESFRSYAEWKNLELTFIKAEEPLVMDQDTEKLGEVMSNLISNAIKFSKEGGKVIVKVWTERRGDDERCHILVKDQGCGISEENLDRVFDPYFRVDRGTMDAIPGTGLGLAITRELVMLMQGSIHATSEPGIGTSFELSLPITNKAESQLAADFEKEPAIPGFDHEAVIEMTKAGYETGLKLLLVEDNHEVMAYLHSLLSSKYRICKASDGEEGWEKALEEIPDLIISDVMMPRMDGFQLCKKLKEDFRTSHIPVILLTARSEMDARLTGLRSGAEAYLSKPFQKEELLVHVENLIALREDLKLALKKKLLASEGNSEDGPLQDGHEDPEVMSRELGFLEKVSTEVKSNLSDEAFGIAELCQCLGMSRSQLYRKFSALTEKSVQEFIKDLRLNCARDLLRSSDLNVSEVAYDTGFKNPSHFSRAYAKKFGLSPSSDRKKALA